MCIFACSSFHAFLYANRSTEGYRGQSLVCEAEVEHVDAMLASDQQVMIFFNDHNFILLLLC